MEDANQIDLTQFKRWYTQAGTPEITATYHYDATNKVLSLTLRQSCPATPGQVEKQPFLIPIAMGLLDQQGQSLPLQLENEAQAYASDTRVLQLRETEQTFQFINVEQQPIISLLRGFSAPVKLHIELDNDELAFLMAHEKDSFNRWDAGQSLFIQIMLSLISDYQQAISLNLPDILIKQCAAVLEDKNADPALVARMLTLPSENYLAAQMKVADVDAIHHVRKFVKDTLAHQLKKQFDALYQQHNLPNVPYQFNSEHMGRRSLKNVCLGYLMATGELCC